MWCYLEHEWGATLSHTSWLHWVSFSEPAAVLRDQHSHMCSCLVHPIYMKPIHMFVGRHAGEKYSIQTFKVLEKMTEKNPVNTNKRSVVDYVRQYIPEAKQEAYFKRILPGVWGRSLHGCVRHTKNLISKSLI